MGNICQADRCQILQHLILEFVPVYHQKDRRLLCFVRFKQQLRGFDHRVSLAAPLRVPDKSATSFWIERSRDDFIDRDRLVLAKNKLLQLLFLFREKNEVFQKPKDVRNITERFDLGFQIADLLALPIEDVSANCVPSYAIRKSDRFGGGENHFRRHHLRRLVVVTPNLINPESDRLVLARVLALDHKHGDAVDQKHYVLAGAVTAIVNVKLFRHFIDVAPLLARAIQVTVIKQCQVELPAFLSAEEFPLIAKVIQEVAIPSNAGVEPLKLSHQSAFGVLVFRIERLHLRVEQIAEEKRRRSSAIFQGHAVGIEPATHLRCTRHVCPADVLRVSKNARLNGFILRRRRHMLP